MKILAAVLALMVQDYPDHVGIVNDFAMELDTDSVTRIEKAAADGKAKSDVRLVVVTVPSLQGQSVEAYTIGLAKKWGVGQKGKNNGILLLHAPKERKIRIENGYGVESRLTDFESKMVIERMIPLMKAGKFAQAMAQASEEIIRTVSAPEKQEKEPEKIPEKQPHQSASSTRADQDEHSGTIAIFGGSLLVGIFGFLFWIHRSNEREAREEALRRKRMKHSPDLPSDPLTGPTGFSGLQGLMGAQGMDGLGSLGRAVTPIERPSSFVPDVAGSLSIAEEAARRRRREEEDRRRREDEEESDRRRRSSSDSSSSSSSSDSSSSSSFDSSSFGGGDFGGGGASGDY